MQTIAAATARHILGEVVADAITGLRSSETEK